MSLSLEVTGLPAVPHHTHTHTPVLDAHLQQQASGLNNNKAVKTTKNSKKFSVFAFDSGNRRPTRRPDDPSTRRPEVVHAGLFLMHVSSLKGHACVSPTESPKMLRGSDYANFRIPVGGFERTKGTKCLVIDTSAAPT